MNDTASRSTCVARFRGRAVAVAAMVVVATWASIAASDRSDRISGTPHDLSSSGALKDRSQAESEVCVFCHVAHGATTSGPLWSRVDYTSSYITYSSRTLNAKPGQPDGDSKLCLSCHDGALAVNAIRKEKKRRRKMSMGAGNELSAHGRISKKRPTYLGLDLSDDHPISFVYDADLAVRDQLLVRPEVAPSGLGGTIVGDLLDKDAKVQCTTCHNAHDNSLGNYLRVSPRGGKLCAICHDRRGYDRSAHNANQSSRFRDNCKACHTQHTAAPATHLLVKKQRDLCGACHGRQAAAMGPRSATRHDIEDEASAESAGLYCSTCHEPHLVRPAKTNERRFLSDPDDAVRPPPLIDEWRVPHSYRDEPHLAAEDSGAFCLDCHDGTWPGAINIQSELASGSVQSQFTDGTQSLHRLHTKVGDDPRKVPWMTTTVAQIGGVEQPEGRVGCTYCHDVHGSNGNRGIPRERLLYDWLTVEKFPYQGKGSCSTNDLLNRCHVRK